MKPRRNFIKTGLVAGVGLSVVKLDRILADNSPPAAVKPILVAVREGERVPMLNRTMDELGGMGAFVKKGQTVVVKPNIGWDAPPEKGANTHPEIVKRVVEMCFAAGAKSVSVFDNPCDQWQRTYANSGIEKAAKDAGATVVNGKDESLYRSVEIPNGRKLKQAKVHSLVLDSDVFINVPVLKCHESSRMTACIKNLMGTIWDRQFYHRTDLHQCMVDLLTVKRPALNILDAYAPMVRNGPRGTSVDDLVVMRALLASTDIVAIDAAGAKMLNVTASDIRHVVIADEMGLGCMDLQKVDVRRLTLA
jgi:uncharacterized protein (DUF362 family)